MNTNDIIVESIIRGSFKFPIDFNMFGIDQSIEEAIYDTGCSHSLISVRSLNVGDADIKDLELDALLDKNVKLSTGTGVESKGANIDELKKCVQKINKWKKDLQRENVSDENAKEKLSEYISREMKDIILDSKNIRYSYMAYNYTIDKVCIGDFEVRVSFKTKANLIGMHIIRELYTKIFSEGNHIFLLAKKNSSTADIELDTAMNELRNYLELPDGAASR